MNHFVPLITQWLPSCTAVVFSADGSDPAPGAGSVMQKQERMSPRASGRSQRSFCSVRGDQFQQMDVGFVGREDVHRNGTEQRIAGFLEHHCLADIVQPEAAEFRRGVRRQQPGLAPKRDQFAAELFGRTVRGLPRVAFQRDDLVADEAARALLQFLQFGREREVHRAVPLYGGGYMGAAECAALFRPTFHPCLMVRLTVRLMVCLMVRLVGRKSAAHSAALTITHHQNARPCAISWANSMMPVPIAVRPA